MRQASTSEPARLPAEPWPRLEPDPDVVPAPRARRSSRDPDAPQRRRRTAEAGRRRRPGEAAAAWVEPVGDVCPTSHPVKAKLASKIFHLPGMLELRPHRRPTAATATRGSAEADGLRAAKR